MPPSSAMTASPADGHRGSPRLTAAICAVLAGLVWVVFGQTIDHQFVNYDDDENVYENPHIIRGLSLRGIVWAFSHSEIGHWDPLTTISHMLDCQLYGLHPWGHHLGNVLLHALAAVLLFLVLRQMTARLWPSAFAAVVFAIHPLRAESVAWVTERKDVLSGVFFMLTLAAYVRYVRQPRSLGRYALVAFLFALGLLCKSMLVTLPCVLLLLDFWPLGRFSPRADSPRSAKARLGFLLLEKVPLLALSAAASVIQLVANRSALVSVEKLPLSLRAGNAVVSYLTYVGQMLFPQNLAVFYPHPERSLPLWYVGLAALLLVAVSWAALAAARTRGYLLIGWLWFLGMLVPVIGLIQSGELAQADRYTYLPQIGLYIALAWLAADLAVRWSLSPKVLAALAAVVIGALVLAARAQTATWQDSQTLWTHALACTRANATAHGNLGHAYFQKGQLDEAIAQFRSALEIEPARFIAYDGLGGAMSKKGRMEEAIAAFHKAIEINPQYKKARNNLGLALVQTGHVEEAIVHLRAALEIDPEYSRAHNNLGTALLRQNALDEAAGHYRSALALNPDFPEAEANLGNTLYRQNRREEAIVHYRQAVALKPDYAKAHTNLAYALLETGQPEDAVAHFTKTLEIQPDSPAVQNDLAWVLATHPDSAIREGARAVQLAQAAVQRAGGGNAVWLRTLAAAYAEAGHFSEALQAAEKALQLAEAKPDPALAESLRAQVQLYRAGSPLRVAP